MKTGTEEKLGKMQALEQNVQNFLMQRQQLQSQLVETGSALEGLEGAKEAYRIIGSVMVLSDKDAIKKELESKKEMIELRIKAIERQEKEIKEKAQKLQKEVLSEMGE